MNTYCNVDLCREVERSRLKIISSQPDQADWLANNTKIVHLTSTLIQYATETPSILTNEGKLIGIRL